MKVKLERLKFAILFMIADMFWPKKTRIRGCKNL